MSLLFSIITFSCGVKIRRWKPFWNLFCRRVFNRIMLYGNSYVFICYCSYPISALLINLIYQIQNSACGYFVNAATMPVYVKWTKYLAYFGMHLVR